MNKFIVCVLIFVYVFVNADAQNIPKWKLDDLKEAIRNAEKPTIFYFWATF